MKHNPLADAMITIKNAEEVGKKTCLVPKSNLINTVLQAMEKAGYIGETRQNKRDITVSLVGKINKSKAITPRHSCSYKDFVKYEKRYLPTRNMGIIIISTSKGVMNHKEAKEAKIGGKLLAYVY